MRNSASISPPGENLRSMYPFIFLALPSRANLISLISFLLHLHPHKQVSGPGGGCANSISGLSGVRGYRGCEGVIVCDSIDMRAKRQAKGDIKMDRGAYRRKGKGD